jgi:hypothetical protein
MKNALESCRVRKDLHQGSDHYSIQSIFSFMPLLCHFEPGPLWKQADKKAIAQKAQELNAFPCSFSSIADIDSGVASLVSWIKDVIKKHVPLSKPALFRIPWWSEKIRKLVEDERKAFRRCRWDQSQLAMEEYRAARNAKGAAIKAAKQRSFEEVLENASSDGEKSIWRLAKWAKSKSFLPPAPPSIPTLISAAGPATTPEAKCEALKARFLLPIPQADLSDIPSFVYPPEKISPSAITLEEITSALSKAKPHKAPGPYGIPVFILKLLGRPLLEHLQALIQACPNFSHHPSCFRCSSTVALRKPGKDNYSVLAAWQLITLLSTLG